MTASAILVLIGRIGATVMMRFGAPLTTVAKGGSARGTRGCSEELMPSLNSAMAEIVAAAGRFQPQPAGSTALWPVTAGVLLFGAVVIAAVAWEKWVAVHSGPPSSLLGQPGSKSCWRPAAPAVAFLQGPFGRRAAAQLYSKRLRRRP